MMITKDQVSRLSEADFRRDILVPLLNALGYKGVYEYHGGRELGKDIVAWTSTRFGHRENIAIVAKSDRISGSKGSGAVAGQVRQALNSPYNDPHTGQTQNVNRVMVMTSKSAPEVARDQVRSHLEGGLSTRLEIMDLDDLWPLIEKHMVIGPHQALSRAEAAINAVDSPYEVDLGLKVEADEFGGRRRVRVATVRARDPEKVSEDELKGRFEIRIPTTPDGLELINEWNDAMASGATVTVPSDYVQVELPPAIRDVAREYFGIESFDNLSIEVGSWENPKTIPVCVTVTGADAHEVELPFIEWKIVRSGASSTEFSNEHQDIGIKVSFEIDHSNRRASISFAIRPGDHAAPALEQFIDLINTYSGACFVEVYSWELRLNLMAAPKEEVDEEPFDSRIYSLVSDLAEIQRRVGVPLIIPSRDLTVDEMRTIAYLRTVLHEGEVESEWTAAEATILAKDLEDVISDMKQLNGRAMRMQQLGRVTLWGQVIDLGPKETLLLNPEVSDIDTARSVAAAAGPDDVITIQIQSHDNGRVLERYSSWAIDGLGQDLVGATNSTENSELSVFEDTVDLLDHDRDATRDDLSDEQFRS